MTNTNGINKKVPMDQAAVAALAHLPENKRLVELSLEDGASITVERRFVEVQVRLSDESGSAFAELEAFEVRELAKALTQAADESKTMWRAIHDWSVERFKSLDCEFQGRKAGSVYEFGKYSVTLCPGAKKSSVIISEQDGAPQRKEIDGLILDSVETAESMLKAHMLERGLGKARA